MSGFFGKEKRRRLTAQQFDHEVEQLVQFVKANFDTERIAVCWDNHTHSFFETLMPGVSPVGSNSVSALSAAHAAGRTLILTDRCAWKGQLNRAVELFELAEFEGNSPAWSKTPSIRLYSTRPLE